MANNNKHTGPNVPALRFPEFSEEWEKFRVSDFIEFFSTNSLSWDQLEYRGAGLLNLHYGMIHNGLPVQVDASKNALPSIKEDYYPKKYTLCKEGDIAFADASEDTNDVGKAIEFNNCAGKSIVCGLHTIHGRDRLGLTSIGFKGYLFSSKVYHDQIKSIAQGTKVFSIKASNFDEVILGLPKKEEQKKISSLLMTIDDRILTQSKIIEELKTLRGALNESLYCCCESYQELSFNDVGVSYSGLSGKSGNDFGSGYPFIPYTNIFTNNIIDEGKLEYVQIREDESQNSVCFGDLLMTLSSETPEEVGIGAVYLGHESPLYLNSFAFGIHITRTDLVYPPYLSWLVSTKSFRKFILPYAQGSTRYNLQKTDFMKAKYRFPTLGRQKAISVLLSGYSSKIENEERVLNKYTALKQGLIEQLFI